MINYADKEIYITPFTGEGIFFYHHLTDEGLAVSGFCDIAERAIGATYQGIPVRSREEVVQTSARENAVFFVVSRNHGKRIAKELLEAGKQVVYIGERFFSREELERGAGYLNKESARALLMDSNDETASTVHVSFDLCSTFRRSINAAGLAETLFQSIKGTVNRMQIEILEQDVEERLYAYLFDLLGHLAPYADRINRLILTVPFKDSALLLKRLEELPPFRWLYSIEVLWYGYATRYEWTEFLKQARHVKSGGAIVWKSHRDVSYLPESKQADGGEKYILHQAYQLQFEQSDRPPPTIEDIHHVCFFHSTQAACLSIKAHLFGSDSHFQQSPTWIAWASRERPGRDRPYSFTNVRNPWDRLVSRFYWHPYRIYGDNGLPFYIRGEKIEDEIQEFRQVLRDMGRHPDRYLLGPLNQVCCDEGGALMMDYVIYYEHLQQGADHVAARLGLTDLVGKPIHNVVKTGATPHRLPYQAYYDDESRDIVARLYAKDIELFGYEFEGIKPEYLRKWGYRVE